MPVFNNPRRMPCFGLAPTLEDFEAIAAEALATIPEEFRRHVGNVRIQIDDFPSDEVEKQMELDTPFDLLGLYQGVSMMERGAGHVANDIDRIFSIAVRSSITGANRARICRTSCAMC